MSLPRLGKKELVMDIPNPSEEMIQKLTGLVKELTNNSDERYHHLLNGNIRIKRDSHGYPPHHHFVTVLSDGKEGHIVSVWEEPLSTAFKVARSNGRETAKEFLKETL